MKYKEQIKMIMQDCDFAGIQKAMTALNICWTYDNGKQIPSVSDLKSIAEQCLNKVAYSQEDSTYSCGGFEAERMNNILELRFVLERVSPLKTLLNNEKNKLEGKA